MEISVGIANKGLPSSSPTFFRRYIITIKISQHSAQVHPDHIRLGYKLVGLVEWSASMISIIFSPVHSVYRLAL